MPLQKLLSLIRSHLFIFVFISITLGSRSKKILLKFMSKSVLPIFSFNSFTVSSLIFRSLIHFEFIFVYYFVSVCSAFILSHEPVQFFQHDLLKRSYALNYTFLLPFVRDQVTISVWVYLQTFYPITLIYISAVMPVGIFVLFLILEEILEKMFSGFHI